MRYTTGSPLHHQGELTATDSREGILDRHYAAKLRIGKTTSWDCNYLEKQVVREHISPKQIEMSKREVRSWNHNWVAARDLVLFLFHLSLSFPLPIKEHLKLLVLSLSSNLQLGMYR